ncbi:hypothetical protein EJB05_12173, partial [Eragrostis curvula]
CRLLYTYNGIAVLALSSNAVQKLWKWKRIDKNPDGVSTTAVKPELWQPEDGTLMINDTTDGNPEEATACLAISRNDGYTISASGGKVKLFSMNTFKAIHTFTPAAATFLAFHPDNNNIFVIGMDDSSIQIYDFRTDKIISKLMGHQKKITGVAFSLFMNLLVSSGADAQLCAWNIERWEKTKTTYIRPPSNCSGALVGDTMVHFDYEGKHLLVVHKSQLAIYDGNLQCLRLWAPRDALSAPISSAVYSSDGLLVYAGFYNGAIGIFEAESLRLQSRIASSAYIPASISSGGGSVYPMVVAAHPFKPDQFAVGMSDGAVYVLEPLDTDAGMGSSGSSEQGPDDDISSDGAVYVPFETDAEVGSSGSSEQGPGRRYQQRR